MQKRTASKVIDNETSRRWLAAYDEANSHLEAAGFPRLLGAPVGHLMEIEPLAREAGDFAASLRRKMSKCGIDIPVEYFVTLSGGEVVAEAYWVA